MTYRIHKNFDLGRSPSTYYSVTNPYGQCVGFANSPAGARDIRDLHKTKAHLATLEASLIKAREWHAEGKTTLDEHAAYVRTLVRRIAAAKTKIETLS
jgi:hypothetical protein